MYKTTIAIINVFPILVVLMTIDSSEEIDMTRGHMSYWINVLNVKEGKII